MLAKAAALLFRPPRITPRRHQILAVWRSMTSSSSSSSSSQPKQAPHLLFTPDPHTSSCFYLFSLIERKIYTLTPPTPSVCLGSGHGWLVTADLVSDPSLFNPATGQTLPLPKLTTLDSVAPILDSGRLVKYRLPRTSSEVIPPALPIMLIYRALPIADSNGDLTVFLILRSPFLALAFAKPGDARWTLVAYAEPSSFLDVHFHKDQIFSVMAAEDIIGWEFGGLFPTMPKMTSVMQNLKEGYNPNDAKWDEKTNKIITRDLSFFLATSPSGDLLRVRKEMVGKEKTAHVKVHRLEWGEYGLAKLVEVKSLGENALLLGANSAICVAADNVPGLRRDCVYFAEGTVLDDKTRTDVGVYNMVDGSVEPISIMIPFYPCPAWIMGSFA